MEVSRTQQVNRFCSVRTTHLHNMRFPSVLGLNGNPSSHVHTITHTHTLTILVLTSFSMALTSSAALGTSEDDCRDVSKDED